MPYQPEWQKRHLTNSIPHPHRGEDTPDGLSEGIPSLLEDNGCEFHNACFTCPFSDCLYVEADRQNNRQYARWDRALMEAREAFHRGERNPDFDSVACVALKKFPKYAPDKLGARYTNYLKEAYFA